MHLYEFHVHAILITGGFDENENYLDSSEYIGKPDLPVGETVHVWSGPKLPNPISAHTMVRISELNADFGWVDSMIIGGWAPEMGATEDTHFLIYVDNDPYNMVQVLEYLSYTKGQIISKCLFGVFNSPKKRTKTIRLEVP